MESAIRPEEIAIHIKAIENADIIVGIPSYNNARTIGHVVRAVQAGFAKYFPDKKAVLVNSDGGSTDGTMDVVHDATIDNLQSILLSHKVNRFVKIATPYHGIPGKGSAFRRIFEIADSLRVKACAVVDSDLRSNLDKAVNLVGKEYRLKIVDRRRHGPHPSSHRWSHHELTRTAFLSGKYFAKPA